MHKATIPILPDNLISGLAREPDAWEKNILRSHQQKLQSLKRKIDTKARKNSKPKFLLCVTSVIFRSNKVRSMLETQSTKATAVGESSNAGYGGRAPSRWKPTEVRSP